MIKLQRLNVVKLVESEERAQSLIRQGFERIEETEAEEVSPVVDPKTEPDVVPVDEGKKKGGK